jgi:hypothetical protein
MFGRWLSLCFHFWVRDVPQMRLAAQRPWMRECGWPRRVAGSFMSGGEVAPSRGTPPRFNQMRLAAQ